MEHVLLFGSQYCCPVLKRNEAKWREIVLLRRRLQRGPSPAGGALVAPPPRFARLPIYIVSAQRADTQPYHFPCSADPEQDWQRYPLDPYYCYIWDHNVHIHHTRLFAIECSSWSIRIIPAVSRISCTTTAQVQVPTLALLVVYLYLIEKADAGRDG